MKTSDVPYLTRPLKDGETIQEGDMYWCFDERTKWIEVPESYLGVEFDAARYVPIRRPITSSIHFIKDTS